MTRPSKRALEKELEELRAGDGSTFGEVVFTAGGEIWGRSTDDGIERATAEEIDGVDSADDVDVLVDFSGGGD